MNKQSIYKKRKLWPFILISVFIMIAVIILGGMFIVRIAINNFKQDCDNIERSVESVSLISAEDLNTKKDVINFYSNEMAKLTVMEDQEITDRLSLWNKLDHFDSIGVISDDNIGKLNNGSTITLPEKIKTELDKINLNECIIESDADKNQIFFIGKLPVNENRIKYLFGLTSTLLSKAEFKTDERLENSIIYIIDENKDVVLSTGHPGEKFNYDDIKEQGLYNGSFEDIVSYWQGFTDDELSEYIHQDQREFDFNFEDFTKLGKDIRDFNKLYNENTIIWFNKPIDIEGEKDWMIYVGREASLSENTKENIFNALIIIFITVFSFLITLVISLISQSAANKKLLKVAFTDPITKGCNWIRFKNYSAKVIRKRNIRYAIVLLDILKYKILSDIYGTEGTSGILCIMNNVLVSELGKREICARYTRDEFAVLVRFTDEEDLRKRISIWNDSIIDALNISNLRIVYGIYIISGQEIDMEKMIAYAGMAKDIAKKTPDMMINIFDEKIRNNLLHERTLEEAAPQAFLDNEFKVYLQPKYSPDGSKVAGAEALVRWISPTLGFISPGEFIPLFEKNMMIVQLDCYMVNAVSALQRKWMDDGKELVTISVNISRSHLRIPTVVDDIISIVDYYEIPHSCIEIELTESAFFDDKCVILETIHKLRERGFYVSMDDFGSGYSSLNSLKDLPLDVVKLDCEFFRQAADMERSSIVIADTISMAKHLNMKIVAEGIETKEQVEFLQDKGCDLIQGFYFAKPMPVGDFEKLFKTENKEEEEINENK